MNCTKNGFFFHNYIAKERKTNLQINLPDKTLCNNKNLQYNEMNKKRLCNVK